MVFSRHGHNSTCTYPLSHRIRQLENHMKAFIFIIFGLLLTNNGVAQNKTATDSIRIEYVNMDIDTPFSIHCDDFDAFFQDAIQSVSIKDSMTVALITSALESLPSDTLNLPPDTRMKISLYKEHVQDICIGRLSLLMNGHSYPLTENLRAILNAILPQ